MAYKNFSKTELIDILEIIEAARNCTYGIQQLLLRTGELVCAEHSVCGLAKLSPNGSMDILGIINGNYPEQWLDSYTSKSLYLNDPIIEYHTRFMSTQCWADTFKLYDNKTTRKFVKMASDFGLVNGMSSGTFDSDTKKLSLFSFAIRDNAINDRCKEIINTITPHLHKATIATFKANELEGCPTMQ